MSTPNASDSTTSDLAAPIPTERLWAQPRRFTPEIVISPAALLTPREQALLYALVFAMAPKRVLEIGVKHGGGTRIIHSALADLDQGTIIALDPEPDIKIDWSTIADRATLMIGRSPDDLGKAADAAGGRFDFVFLDGSHYGPHVLADLQGLAEVTAPGALILCHDSYYVGVREGITNAKAAGLPYIDAGNICHTPNHVVEPERGTRDVWGGMQLIRRAEKL